MAEKHDLSDKKISAVAVAVAVREICATPTA
jgi:hypothetical protein